MSTKLTLLEVLNQNTNAYLSGQELADRLGISRNAVWKAMKKLQEQGALIESRPGVGYRLIEQRDVVTRDYLKAHITKPCKYLVFDSVDSTNRVGGEIEDLTLPHIIVANEQTKGRGRLGRSFYSPAGTGLYLTMAFRPDFSLDKAMLVTTIAAVAVCRAMEKVTGLSPKIKWVNDIYLNDKKICGILTEAQSSVETGSIDRIIIGIGINCFQSDFPEELRERASFIENPLKQFTRNELAAAIVNEFFSALEDPDTGKTLQAYKARSFLIGEQIMIYNTISGQSPDQNTKGILARAMDIDERGGLVVQYLEGPKKMEVEIITSGEVSIRKW